MGGALIAIVDDITGTDGPDVAYIDHNRNRDFSDEKPLPLSRSSYVNDLETQWVETSTLEGSPVPVRLVVRQDEGPCASAQRKGAWVGKVRSNRGDLTCAMVDVNCNGVFSDRFRMRRGFRPTDDSDCAFIDPDGRGIDFYAYGPHALRLQDMTAVGRGRYHISASDSGDTLTIRRYAGTAGKVSITGSADGSIAKPGDAVLIGKPGFYTISGDRAAVPPGAYKILACSVSLGNSQLRCTVDHEVSVSAGKETKISIGGPVSHFIRRDKGRLVLKPGVRQRIEWAMKIGDDGSVISIGASGDVPSCEFADSAGKSYSANLTPT